VIVNVSLEDNINSAVSAELKAQFGVDSVRELANHVICCRPSAFNGSSVFDSGLGLVSMSDNRYENIK
jgi:hypothetical protein